MEEVKIPLTRKEPVFMYQIIPPAYITSGYPFKMFGEDWYAVHEGGRWIVIHKESGMGGTPRTPVPIKTRAELIRQLNDEKNQKALQEAMKCVREKDKSDYDRRVDEISAARRQYYEEKEALKNAEDNQGR